MNAQGEDVVAGTRATQRIATLAKAMPRVWKQFTRACTTLERHCRDVQDVEFTVERGKLWMLQTRDAKRTAQAAVRIAVDLARARRITRAEAVQRVTPEQVDYFLHPQFPPQVRRAAQARGDLIATGLNVSPGRGVGHAGVRRRHRRALEPRREEGRHHGAAGDQARRRARHARGARHPDVARRPHEPRGAGGAAVRQAGGRRAWRRWTSIRSRGSSRSARACCARATPCRSTGRPARCSRASSTRSCPNSTIRRC